MPGMIDKKKMKKRRLAIIIGLSLLAGLLAIILTLIMLFQSELPSLDQLHNIQPSLSARVLDKDGKLLKEFYKQRRQMIPYEKIPPYMTDCLLAVEDRRFYDHWGVDLRRLAAAFFHNLVNMDLTSQGASTLTQQLARSLFLTPEKIVSRKIKEALTAVKIEQTYSKQQILELYLNQHYFGKGAYGIEAAAGTYFSKHADELTLPECAVLVGVLKSPNPYNPINHPDKAIKRRNIVYDALADCKKLSRLAADSLSRMPLTVNPRDERNGTAPYFTEMIRQYLSDRYGEDALFNGGLTVHTTLDGNYQNYAENAIKLKLGELQDQMEKYIRPGNPKHPQYTISVPDETKPGTTHRVYKQIQSALLCIDNQTAGVLAYIGGKDFDQSKFNRVIQALRQPGSSFKPIVYTTAIDNGFKPTDLFMDSPIVLTAGGEEWRPSNFDEKFDGEMTLRDALKESRNLIAIKLMMEPTVTAEQVIKYAQQLGIRTKLTPVPSLAIGSCEVTLWDMATVFSVFPNGGIRREPYYITKIVDRYGNILEQRNKVDQEEVLSPQTAYIMTNLMQTVINSGTGYPARQLGFARPAAGKTGTTNEHTDNWFIGFTPQITTAVWVGYDDKTTIGIWKGEVGATTALPIWTEYMKAACADLPSDDFVVPPGIYTASICLESGKLASPRCSRVVTDVFTEKTLPKSQCDLKHYGDSSERDKEGRFKSDDDRGKKRF
jgi:penicillin-binding protein 1A